MLATIPHGTGTIFHMVIEKRSFFNATSIIDKQNSCGQDEHTKLSPEGHRPLIYDAGRVHVSSFDTCEKWGYSALSNR